MWQLDSSKSHKIKDGQEFKHTDKWIKLVKEVDNDIPPQVESKGSTKADDADILSQVWDERVSGTYLMFNTWLMISKVML